MQLGAQNGGLAFVTKHSLQQAIAVLPSKPTALLLPNSDKLDLKAIDDKFQVAKPIEVVVSDPLSNAVFKRQVVVIQITPTVKMTEPKPTYTGKLADVCEIVLELDPRFTTKDFVSNATSVIEVMKTKAIDQFGSQLPKPFNLYAHRVVKIDKELSLHQAMVKIPASARSELLQKSGCGELLVRDFIPKGTEIEDVSVLPRFFDANKAGKQQALRIAEAVTGFAGVQMTRRGLAIRAWSKDIASVRKIVMAHDDRLNEINIGVVPKFSYDTTGWPASVTPDEVIRAINHALKIPPILTRTYKSLGMTTWSVAFATKPTVGRFAVKFNDAVSEIIVAPINRDSRNSLRKDTKVKGNEKPKIVAESNEQRELNDQLQERVGALEAKFGNLEIRTNNIEGKLAAGFDEVNSQLRQVLNVITSRAAPSEHTGLTPPPKSQKLQ